jgi:glutathione reductase (NADPH)
MKRRGVEVIRDRGRFVGPNTAEVGGETLEAKHIVIATGSKPRQLSFPGVALATRALEMA